MTYNPIPYIVKTFGINESDLYKPTHDPKIGDAKKILCKYLYECDYLTLHAIRQLLHYVNHTSVINCIKKCNAYLDTDKDFQMKWLGLFDDKHTPHITAMGKNTFTAK